MKQVFATHGIPHVIASDNGPQFTCYGFRVFVKQSGFKHITSSPYFLQRNVVAENVVKIAKKSPDIALLNYRATGVSLAEVLMGRRLQTRVPTIHENLRPVGPSMDKLRSSDKFSKAKTKETYDRHHGDRVVPQAL